MKKQEKPKSRRIPEADSMAEAEAFGDLMYFALSNPDHPLVRAVVEEETKKEKNNIKSKKDAGKNPG